MAVWELGERVVRGHDLCPGPRRALEIVVADRGEEGLVPCTCPSASICPTVAHQTCDAPCFSAYCILFSLIVSIYPRLYFVSSNTVTRTAGGFPEGALRGEGAPCLLFARLTRYMSVMNASPTRAMSLRRVLRNPGSGELRGRKGAGFEDFRGGYGRCIVGRERRPGKQNSLGLNRNKSSRWKANQSVGFGTEQTSAGPAPRVRAQALTKAQSTGRRYDSNCLSVRCGSRRCVGARSEGAPSEVRNARSGGCRCRPIDHRQRRTPGGVCSLVAPRRWRDIGWPEQLFSVEMLGGKRKAVVHQINSTRELSEDPRAYLRIWLMIQHGCIRRSIPAWRLKGVGSGNARYRAPLNGNFNPNPDSPKPGCITTVDTKGNYRWLANDIPVLGNHELSPSVYSRYR